MQVTDDIHTFRQYRRQLSGRVGLVPTMGYLHRGHLSLVEYARVENDVVVATIFVNPTQFNQEDDYNSYPRDISRDLDSFRDAGVDLVFTPTPEAMYLPRHQTTIAVSQVSQRLEGEHRPGHFLGVATVVAKVFNIIQPDAAYFGQKDAQQCVVVRQMVRDLNFPIEIVICPTQREHDGLALSSRNVHLTPEQRQAATVLCRTITRVNRAYKRGERNPDVLRQIALDTIAEEPLATPDYISIANPSTLGEITTTITQPVLLSMTIQIGKVRLLDNSLLPASLNTREHLSSLLGAQ